MDIRENIEDPEEVLRSVFVGMMKGVWTAMPARVTEDSDGHTVSVQPTIKRAVTNPTDGSLSFEDHPVHVDVPIHFASGGGVTMTHPVKQHDEGVIIYASRSLDAWHQSGGTQQPMEDRMHHQGDAMYIPGIRSTPRKLNPPPSTTSSQMRSDDGHHIVDLHPTKGLTLKSAMSVTLDAPNHVIKGALSVAGTIALGKAADGTGGSMTIENDLNVTKSITAKSVTAPEGSVGT